jgi:UDP-glucose 4-epimerase
MRVLVTGGGGFIGSHVADALIARGDTVTLVDDLSGGNSANINPDAQFEQLDIRGPEAADLIRSQRPDAIVHHAAQVSVSRSVREPQLDAEINIAGTLSLIVAASEVGARFVYASSGGAMYGEADVIPTPETYPAKPSSPYGISKYTGELYLRSFSLLQQLGYVSLRYSNVYGPRQDAHGEAGVVALFTTAMLEGRQPTIHGDGFDTRDYVFVEDVVRANLLALDATESGGFNVGTGHETTANQVFQLLRKLTGSQAEDHHGPHRAGDLHRSCLDISLIGQVLGWRPQVALEEGLEKTVDWFREHVGVPSRPTGGAA